MKNAGCIFLIAFLLFSCRGSNKKETVAKAPIKELSKLEKLYLLPHDSVMAMYDLSNDSINVFPNLSSYSIKSLDLSANLLDTIIVDYLPKQLEQIYLSHNLFKSSLCLEENDIPKLRELDMSYNRLESANIWLPLYKINLSHNDLTIACFNQKNLCYLDVSYNCNMPAEVCFEPTQIDTVIRDGVAEGERLVGPISVWYYKQIE